MERTHDVGGGEGGLTWRTGALPLPHIPHLSVKPNSRKSFPSHWTLDHANMEGPEHSDVRCVNIQFVPNPFPPVIVVTVCTMNMFYVRSTPRSLICPVTDLNRKREYYTSSKSWKKYNLKTQTRLFELLFNRILIEQLMFSSKKLQKSKNTWKKLCTLSSVSWLESQHG